MNNSGSIELQASYLFEYKEDLNAHIVMQKANPIKAYIVNSATEKDLVSFADNNPKLYYPNKKAIEFRFTFQPENPSEIYGKPIGFLERYDQLFFPWASFIHYLALLKVGGKASPSSDPTLSFQLTINGRVYIDQKQVIKALDPNSKVLIFRTEPELFKNIEAHYLESMGLNDE